MPFATLPTRYVELVLIPCDGFRPPANSCSRRDVRSLRQGKSLLDETSMSEEMSDPPPNATPRASRVSCWPREPTYGNKCLLHIYRVHQFGIMVVYCWGPRRNLFLSRSWYALGDLQLVVVGTSSSSGDASKYPEV